MCVANAISVNRERRVTPFGLIGQWVLLRSYEPAPSETQKPLELCPRRPLREGFCEGTHTSDAGLTPPGACMAIDIRGVRRSLMMKRRISHGPATWKNL